MTTRKHSRKQIGFSYRKLASGNYQFRVSNGTNAPTPRTFQNFEAGERWARQLVALHKDGLYGTHRLAANTTLAEALQRYTDEVSALKRGRQQEVSRARILKSLPIATLPLAELRASHFSELKIRWLTSEGPEWQGKDTPKGKKRAALSPATVNRYLALLHHLFEQARREWGFSTLENPVSDVRRAKEENARDRRVSRSEYAAIVRYAKERVQNPYFLHFFRFSIRCPQRKTELLKRTWGDIDLKEGRMRIAMGKTGPRYSPLLPGALKMLREMKEEFRPKPTDLIFPMSANAVDMIWKKLKQHECIRDLHWHDLRHEGCSQAAITIGFDLAILQKVSGHKSISQLLRYVNHSMRDVHAAVARARATRIAGENAARPVTSQAVDSSTIADEVSKQLNKLMADLLHSKGIAAPSVDGRTAND